MAGYRKLSRTADQRKALIRGQVTSLLYHGKIVTTEQKAKEIEIEADGILNSESLRHLQNTIKGDYDV